MLEIHNLTKHYPAPKGQLTVLTDVNLTLKPGEAAAIMGPSGSGKSTLLYILGGLDSPSAGTITLAAQPPSSANTGFVFQDHCLLPQCSVLENVLIPTLIRPAADYGARARHLIERVGLKDRIDHRPAELSGGEKQRVAIARALIGEPALLLCDEPTGNLDARTAASITELLLELHRALNNVLVVVTHSSRVADEFPLRFELAEGRLSRV
jgi:lipoprotein-releasing system ATP-binding protein